MKIQSRFGLNKCFIKEPSFYMTGQKLAPPFPTFMFLSTFFKKTGDTHAMEQIKEDISK